MFKQNVRAVLSVAVLFSLSTIFEASPARAEDWLDKEGPIAVRRMLANISPKDARPGVVIASPSRKDPDYYYHWIRDAGLVMDVVVKTHGRIQMSKEKLTLKQMLLDYSEFSRLNQMVPSLTGLGEPRFHVDGASYIGPWARPQNDGPALRAVTLIQFAEQLLDEGETKYVRSYLYDSVLPTGSVIKTDLEYVSHHWRDSNFDLWEETKGHHFYTRMVQRKALIKGAALAARLGDYGASGWYLRQAEELQKEIEKHWDSGKGYVLATLGRDGGVDYKHTNLDVAVVLGVLHGYAGDGFFSASDYRIQATMRALEETFRKLYPINWQPPGVAIGRYPEDRYAGSDFNGGNPWVLTTLALAEAYYQAAAEVAQKGDAAQAETYKAKAREFVTRVEKHTPADGALAEQIQRQTGQMTSAADLTWSYASVLTALWARQAANSK